MSTPTPPTNSPDMTLLVRGFEPDQITVTGFRGEEHLNDLYWFELDVWTQDLDLIKDRSMLGLRATFMLEQDGHQRHIRGIVSSVIPNGANTFDQQAWKVRIVPELWLFQHKSNYRVYQNLKVFEILRQVVGDRVTLDVQLRMPHRNRSYCLQYNETDLEFIERILAEEGICFYFTHGGGERNARETMVLFDLADVYPQLDVGSLAVTPPARGRPASLYLRDTQRTDRNIQDLHRFDLEHTIRPQQMLFRDYDYRRPMLELREEHAVRGSGGRRTRGRDDAPGEEEPKTDDLRVYHFAGDDERPDVTATRARVRLDQHRRDAVLGKGSSFCWVLSAGHIFFADCENRTTLNGEYVITTIEHRVGGVEAGPAQGYYNSFRFVPADVPFRPARPPRQTRQVVESATVVGPPDDDIFTDDLGRVKVQFHWDTRGAADEDSSCWVRVAQSWSGPSWGAQFLPRIGTEVLVAFRNGDADCPVVVGSLFNGAQPMPFGLPGDKTRSGIRTESTPGGGGYNELSFQDLAGEEQVFLRAQRDFEAVVGNNRTLNVEQDELVSVTGSQTNLVGRDQWERVDGNAERKVLKSEEVIVGEARNERIGGGHNLDIGEDRVTDVGGAERLRIGRTQRLEVEDDQTIRILGNQTTIVGQAEAPRSQTVHVEGRIDMTSRQLTEISSDTGIRLRCGESVLEITPNGIQLLGREVTLRAPGAGMMVDDGGRWFGWADECTTLRGDRVVVKSSSGAALRLHAEALLDGDKVRLNAPANAREPIEEDDREPTVIELTDAEGEPRPHHPFVLVFEDGTERSGVLDENGRAEVYIEESATVRFPGLHQAESA
ncbi:MAG: type VI secretion system tip protein TssI/VgrG [Myxococcota bacterium]